MNNVMEFSSAPSWHEKKKRDTESTTTAIDCAIQLSDPSQLDPAAFGFPTDIGSEVWSHKLSLLYAPSAYVKEWKQADISIFGLAVLLSEPVVLKGATKDIWSFVYSEMLPGSTSRTKADVRKVHGIGLDDDGVIGRRACIEGAKASGLLVLQHSTASDGKHREIVSDDGFTVWSKKEGVSPIPTNETMADFLNHECRHGPVYRKVLVSKMADGKGGHEVSFDPQERTRTIVLFEKPLQGELLQKLLVHQDSEGNSGFKLLCLEIEMLVFGRHGCDESCMEPVRLHYGPAWFGKEDNPKPFFAIHGRKLLDPIPIAQKLIAKLKKTTATRGTNRTYESKRFDGKMPEKLRKSLRGVLLGSLIEDEFPKLVYSRASGDAPTSLKRCPFCDEHKSNRGQADGSLYAFNPNPDKGLLFPTVKCRHNSCAHRKTDEFVAKLIELGDLTQDDVFQNPNYREHYRNSAGASDQIALLQLRALVESKGIPGEDDGDGGLTIQNPLGDGTIIVRDAKLFGHRPIAEGPLAAEEYVAALLGDEQPSEEFYISKGEVAQSRSDLQDLEFVKKLNPNLLKSVNEAVSGPDDLLTTTLRLNREWAHVVLESGSFMYSEKTGALLKESAFKSKLKNDKIIVPGEEGKPPTVHLSANVWHEHTARRSYDAVGLYPNGLTSHGERYEGDALNSWRGYIWVPQVGDYDLILKHWLEVFHQGDDANYHWDLGWHAQLLIEPHLKMHTSIVRHGEPGAGKGMMGKMLRERIIGPFHSFHATKTAHLTQKFNYHLARALLVQGDEVSWGGSREARDTLFSLVGDDSLSAESKGKDVVQIQSYHRVLLNSNDEKPAPIEGNDRRFAVFETMPDDNYFDADREKKEELKRIYYNALAQQTKGAGALAFAKYLVDFAQTPGYRALDLRTPPMTASKIDILMRCLPKEKAWIADVATQGRLLYDEDGMLRDFELSEAAPTLVPSHVVFKSAEPYFRTYGSPKGLETAVGNVLRKHDLILRKTRREVAGALSPDDRTYYYEFPRLGEFRERVARMLKIPVQRLSEAVDKERRQPQPPSGGNVLGFKLRK